MRAIELSNHPEAMRRAAEEQRSAQAADAQQRYERSAAQHRGQVDALREERDRARAERRWGGWLRGSFAVRGARKRAPLPPAPPRVDVHRDNILASGMQGEQLVANELAAGLADDWTLLRGYRNRGGEIDHLLLGPAGIFAIEVKHRNATISCDGDQWWFQKFDKYGNPVERGMLADRRGRSPSQQLNQPADLLVALLRSHGHEVSIRRVVLFTHPRSRLGGCVNLTVGLVATSTSHVLKEVREAPAHLSAELLAELERLIVHDHRSREQQRARR